MMKLLHSEQNRSKKNLKNAGFVVKKENVCGNLLKGNNFLEGIHLNKGSVEVPEKKL